MTALLVGCVCILRLERVAIGHNSARAALLAPVDRTNPCSDTALLPLAWGDRLALGEADGGAIGQALRLADKFLHFYKPGGSCSVGQFDQRGAGFGAGKLPMSFYCGRSSRLRDKGFMAVTLLQLGEIAEARSKSAGL